MDKFIRELYIDWNKIHEDSYLRDIEATKNLESRDSFIHRLFEG